MPPGSGLRFAFDLGNLRDDLLPIRFKLGSADRAEPSSTDISCAAGGAVPCFPLMFIMEPS